MARLEFLKPIAEGLPEVLGNKGAKEKFHREHIKET